MAEKGIRLHPKYGLNPTISQCIICGKDMNEIVLLGAACKDRAPMKMITSIEPCDECRKKYLATGVLLIESDEEKNPTGKLAVITDSAFEDFFDVPIPAKKICYVEFGLLKKIGVV